MRKKLKSRNQGKKPKNVFLLPDLEHAKAAVLSSLSNTDAQRGYSQAIDEFVDWYCSEPRQKVEKPLVEPLSAHVRVLRSPRPDKDAEVERGRRTPLGRNPP